MITSLDQLDLNKTNSYDDYLKWRFEERMELINGKIFKMSPAAAWRHQRISGVFQGEHYKFLDNKTCQLYSAPYDVRLSPRKNDKTDKIHTVVQPDLCVIYHSSKLDDNGGIGAPDWIIKILSLGNSQKEMKTNLRYMRKWRERILAGRSS